MKSEKIANIVDYLSNSLDRDSDEEIIEFLSESFEISEKLAEKILKQFIGEFGHSSIIGESEAYELVQEHLS